MARVSDEWFRSGAWDEPAREDFERRLTAARPQVRAQYLRLKALSLLAATELDAARDLLVRSLEQPGLDSSERAGALEQLGRIAVQAGRPGLAQHYLRAALIADPQMRGTTGTVEIGLAEVLIDTGEEDAMNEAADLLSHWMARSGLQQPAQLLRWNIALLRLAQADGDRETAREVARTALALATAESLLPRQKRDPETVLDSTTLDALRELAR